MSNYPWWTSGSGYAFVVDMLMPHTFRSRDKCLTDNTNQMWTRSDIETQCYYRRTIYTCAYSHTQSASQTAATATPTMTLKNRTKQRHTSNNKRKRTFDGDGSNRVRMYLSICGMYAVRRRFIIIFASHFSSLGLIDSIASVADAAKKTKTRQTKIDSSGLRYMATWSGMKSLIVLSDFEFSNKKDVEMIVCVVGPMELENTNFWCNPCRKRHSLHFNFVFVIFSYEWVSGARI